MKLTAQVKLLATKDNRKSLLATMEKANRAANSISNVAWETQTFRQYDLHKAVYHQVRMETNLSAQVVIRIEAKVADAYKLDKKTKRVFKPHGAITYDDRIIRWFDDSVSIWTVDGRQRIPFRAGDFQKGLLQYRQGECDLVLANDEWYVMATCEVPEQPPGTPDDWIGVDLGVVNIATMSTGTTMSGKTVTSLRKRHRKLRSKLQVRGTKGAKRLLKKRGKKERNFGKHTNHVISKQIVAMAKDTNCGIALEDLTGITKRVTVRKSQRATTHSWSFYQLRSFIEYKSKRDGVLVQSVDPRNTSRTCPNCNCIDKKNRPNQSSFVCVSCGFSGLADHIAAINIGRRAAVNQPYYPSYSA